MPTGLGDAHEPLKGDLRVAAGLGLGLGVRGLEVHQSTWRVASLRCAVKAVTEGACKAVKGWSRALPTLDVRGYRSRRFTYTVLRAHVFSRNKKGVSVRLFYFDFLFSENSVW